MRAFKGQLVRFSLLSVSVAAIAVSATPAMAQAQVRDFNIPAQTLSSALLEFSRQSDVLIVVSPELTEGKQSPALHASLPVNEAIARLLRGSGLRAVPNPRGGYRIERSVAARNNPPQTASSGNGRVVPVVTDNAGGDIVVTGTRISGVAPIGSALIVHDRREIEQSGAGTAPQFLRELPENFANVDETGQYSSGTAVVAAEFARGSSANIHGVGVGSTLTLLNGRRLAPTGFQGNVVDVSTIPLAAIERVEVLTDGASAIYGSDAVAGVVNFVLRDRYDGAETTFRYGNSTDGGGEEFGASGLVGRSWSSGSALASVDYYHQDPVRARQRDFVTFPAGQGDLTIIPTQERVSGFLNLRQNLTPDLEAYATGLYSKRNFGVFQPSSFGFSNATGDSSAGTGTVGLRIHPRAVWHADISASLAKASASVESVTTLTTGAQITTASDTRSRVATIDAVVNGELLELPGGRMRIALGGQYRWEGFDDLTSSRVRFTGGDGAFLRREVASLFGELYLPLLGSETERGRSSKLAVSIAAHYDDYNDFGSSVNPKFGIEWLPLPGLRFRGNWARSFRAPPLPQSSGIGAAYSVLRLSDPADTTDGITNVIIKSGAGHDGLDPERSTSLSLGVDYQPAFFQRLRLSVSYFDIRYRDRITNPPLNGSILQLFSQRATLAPYIQDDPSLATVQTIFASPNFTNTVPALTASQIEAIFDFTPTNVAKSRTQGFDFRANYNQPIGAGTLSAALSATYLLRSEFQAADNLPVVDLVDTIFNPVDWRSRFTLAWAQGGFSASGSVNYTDSYRNTAVAPVTRIGSWTTFDASLSYRFGAQSSHWLRGLRLALTANNLTDQDPPLVTGVTGTAGYDGANASPRGRFIAFSITKEW